MLVISQTPFDISTIIDEYPENSIERTILKQMDASSEKYQYEYLNQLKFELNLRKEIVNSAIDLNNSELKFANFKDSRCNLEYWNRTDNGGFMINADAKPNEAINDIFINGSLYATECATAMMIIYYKGLLNVYGDELFNKLFTKIYLMDWDVTEPLLKEVNKLHETDTILLGDRGYFNNPDFNPETPEWKGENVIVLPDSLYYGHGIGIANAERIISVLNTRRKDNATQSAHLLNSVGRPNFKKLSGVFYNHSPQTPTLVWKDFPPPIARR